jgi:RNA recognition motif-containing protein
MKESFDSSFHFRTRSFLFFQVDYSTTEEELKQHFQGFGTINRVTIRKDKVTGKPMG